MVLRNLNFELKQALPEVSHGYLHLLVRTVVFESVNFLSGNPLAVTVNFDSKGLYFMVLNDNLITINNITYMFCWLFN